MGRLKKWVEKYSSRGKIARAAVTVYASKIGEPCIRLQIKEYAVLRTKLRELYAVNIRDLDKDLGAHLGYFQAALAVDSFKGLRHPPREGIDWDETIFYQMVLVLLCRQFWEDINRKVIRQTKGREVLRWESEWDKEFQRLLRIEDITADAFSELRAQVSAWIKEFKTETMGILDDALSAVNADGIYTAR